MRVQVDEETDDEYLDDPIKLFDLEQDRVHFGSQLQHKGNMGNAENCQSKEDVTYKSDVELSESSDLEDSSECVPVRIKLVDCKKFPWYYKKYTQQILDKTNMYDLVSDSENELEIDVEYLSDNNDCFILNDISEDPEKKKLFNNFSVCSSDHTDIALGNDEHIENCSIKDLPEVVIHKTKAEKRQETMKQRDNIEIQIALERKNMEKVDFKRNIGLVGMTITQKVIKNVDKDHKTIQRTIKAKEKKMKKTKTSTDTAYLRAADKMLSKIGTELIPFPAAAESNITPNDNVSLNDDSKVTNKKVPVQFSLGKISKKLLDRITTSKTTDDKPLNIESNKQQSDLSIDDSYKISNLSNKMNNTSNHIKNIKKTNKYKNDQIKAIKQMIMVIQDKELDIQQQNKTDTKKTLENDIKPVSPEIAEKISEPNSPILHCSTIVKKNRDISEISKNNVTNHTNNFSQVVDMPKSIGDINAPENKIKLSIEVDNKNTVNMKPRMDAYQDSQNHNLKLQNNRSCEIESQLIVDNNRDKILTRPNNGTGVKNIEPTCQGKSNNHPMHIVSITSISSPHKTNLSTSLANIHNNVASSSIDASQNKTMVAISTPNSSSFNPCIRNVSVNKSNISGAPKTVNNTYASAIILRPNPPINSQMPVRFNQPNFESSRIPTPQFYQNSYYANIHTLPAPPVPPHYGLEQRFIPRSANCAVPNFRFPPPNIAPPLENTYKMPFYQHNNSWQQPNMLSKKSTKGKIYPWRLPETSLQTPQGPLSARYRIINVDASSPTSDGKMVKSNPNKTIKDLSSDNVELINKKAKMLEELNRASSQLKRSIENNTRELEEAVVNTFKRPRILKKPETVAIEDNNKQVEQKNGYSAPILPIPTYEKIMDQVICEKYKQDVHKVKTTPSKRTSDKPNKRDLSHYHDSSTRKEDTKKISLEEYKKRTFKMYNQVEDSYKKVCRHINDHNKKRHNMQDKNRGNVDRFSTESDLGYDSDSTVIL